MEGRRLIVPFDVAALPNPARVRTMLEIAGDAYIEVRKSLRYLGTHHWMVQHLSDHVTIASGRGRSRQFNMGESNLNNSKTSFFEVPVVISERIEVICRSQVDAMISCVHSRPSRTTIPLAICPRFHASSSSSNRSHNSV